MPENLEKEWHPSEQKGQSITMLAGFWAEDDLKTKLLLKLTFRRGQGEFPP